MTDVLEAIVGPAPVTKKHDALVSAIAQKTALHDIALVTTRGHFVPMPHRILDRAGEVISHNFEEWMRDKLDRHHGDHVAVWQAYKGLHIPRTRLLRSRKADVDRWLNSLVEPRSEGSQ